MPKIKKTKTINNIIVQYLEYCSHKNLRIKTIKSYHETLMLFSKYLEDVGKEISDVTINGYLRNIKAFFSYAEENNIVKKNNISSIKFLKAARKPKDQLTNEEYTKLIKRLNFMNLEISQLSI